MGLYEEVYTFFHVVNTHQGLLQLLWWGERDLRLRCCSVVCAAFWQCGALRLYEEVYTFVVKGQHSPGATAAFAVEREMSSSSLQIITCEEAVSAFD